MQSGRTDIVNTFLQMKNCTFRHGKVGYYICDMCITANVERILLHASFLYLDAFILTISHNYYVRTSQCNVFV